MAGRTTWWAHDAAWHRRERQVLLGAEFGAAGPNVLSVLHSWAQEQGHTGQVKGGFTTLAREAFADNGGHAGTIVDFAVQIGALDDLCLSDDGRLFTVRISGWEAEQRKPKEAAKKANSRAKKAAGTNGDIEGQRGTDSVPVPESPPTTPDHTTPDQTNGGGGSALDRLSLIDLSAASSRFRSAWPVEEAEIRYEISLEPADVQEQAVDWLLGQYRGWNTNGVLWAIKGRVLPGIKAGGKRPADAAAVVPVANEYADVGEAC